MATTVTTASEWAAVEFGGVELGDRRRNRRLVRMATTLAQEAHGTLPGSFPGWAETKAAYRLLEEADVTYERIIDPHFQRVRDVCRQGGEYLLVEDTTALDFNSHLAAQDLGAINNAGGRGLWVHSTLALRIEGWNEQQEPAVIVEGLFDQRWWARTAPPMGKGQEKKRQRLSRSRESQRWAAAGLQAGLSSGAEWTWVADREADIFEAFGRCREHGWHFIIRAGQPRALSDEEGSLFETVAQSREAGRFNVELRSRPAQAARRAEVAVRACTVTLRPPWRPGSHLPPCPVNVVEARELHPPAGVEPIHWVLLTDWPIGAFAQVLRVVKAYSRRWLIEEYHKALKTGTGIEQSQLTTAQRIGALLGILAVVAGRLLNMKLLAATQPDQPVSADELGPEALAILRAKFGSPPDGWTNGTVLVAIARLGGFLARKRDGTPGWITIWRGWRKLMWLVQGYNLANGERCG